MAGKTDLTTPAGVVEQGMRVFERIETELDDSLPDYAGIAACLREEMVDVIEAGYALGMCGNIRRQALVSRAKLAGWAAEACGSNADPIAVLTLTAEVYQLHDDLTVIAQAQGVDVPQTQRSGGTRP